jgi:DNA-binding transcriptional regulator YiaG
MPKTSELAEIRRLAKTGRARIIRTEAQLSLAEVAAEVRNLSTELTTPTTVLRWERGERSPHGEAALAYLKVLRALDGDQA